MDLTYVALKRLRVAGKYRNPGDPVPEAKTWRNLPAYIANGSITAVPATAEVAESTAEVVEENTAAEEAEARVAALNIKEFKELVTSGEVSAEDGLRIEKSHQGRTTLISWLEEQNSEDDEDGSDDEDDQDEE